LRRIVRSARIPAAAFALAAASLAAAAPAPLAAQEAGGIERIGGGVQIDFQGTDLPLVVAALAEAAGLNLVYADLPSRPVTLRTGTPVPVERLRLYLENLLRAQGLELVEEEGGLLRVAGGGAPAARSAPGYGAPAAGAPGPVQVFVHGLRHAPADDLARSLGALYGLRDGTGGAERPTSLTEQLRAQRYDGPPAPGTVPPAGPVGVPALLEGPVQIVPDMRTNALLIRASPADYATLARAIDQLDTRPLQVLIEVLVAEVRRDRQFGLGIDVNVPEQRDPRTGALIGGELTGASAGDVVLRFLQLGRVRADVVLRALSASGEVTVLSRPVVVAQNNEEARILVGTQRPFIQISRSLPTDGAVRDQVVQYREVGTRLTIRPTINPDGYVTLAVLQEVSSATPETQFGAPIISTREAETRLLVRDGHTVVIGGLVDQQRSVRNTGIPVLREIPLLGALFRSTSRRTDVTELFLFIVPHVLRTDDDVDAATELIRERLPRLDRALPDSIPLFWFPADTLRLDPAGTPEPPRRPGPPLAPPDRTPARPPRRAGPPRLRARRSRRPAFPGAGAGFTLVELAAALVVLGIAAAVVVPALGRAAPHGAGPAAKEAALEVGRARLAAVTRATPVAFDLDLASGGWVRVALPAGAPPDTMEAGALPLGPGTRLGGGDGAAARVAFDARGRARADRLWAAGADGTFEMEVDPWSGAARVHPR
jgi:prepilin-type N-terminal cleavage/methylation domain-containing protein